MSDKKQAVVSAIRPFYDEPFNQSNHSWRFAGADGRMFPASANLIQSGWWNGSFPKDTTAGFGQRKDRCALPLEVFGRFN